MARVIQLYIPTRFQRKVKWVAPQQRGKMIQFPERSEKIGVGFEEENIKAARNTFS
jgi:hypothetical protein